MSVPIVMAAFGTSTSTRARQTYKIIDEQIKKTFPEHPVYWAFTSRMVKDRVKAEQGKEYKHPDQVLEKLSRLGHKWAVVQSLHLISGHEFYRLLDEVKACPVRISIGLPLLDSPDDYQKILQILGQELRPEKEEALVLVGHGTDHAIWTAYLALEKIGKKLLGNQVFAGVVEGWPKTEDLIKEINQAGYKKVRLIPFMLVSGVHFQEDLCGPEDSWKAMFEDNGFQVSYESRGLGLYPRVVDIFCRHIQEAIDVIPEQTAL